jgi:hypothetical protein
MTALKWLATATLLLSVSACGPGYQAYRSDSPYSPSTYVYTTGQPTYYNSSPGYSPNAAYTPQYSNETPASRYGYNSQGDYYRNYGGTYHPGPERNCPGC